MQVHSSSFSSLTFLHMVHVGSGKSTLIQYILTAKHGFKIAVILNEFGDSAGIESINNSANGPTAALLSAPPTSENKEIDTTASATAQAVIKSNTEWLELANGCLCCTVKDAGVTAIENLMSQSNTVFDYILLESTGLADPGPIASMFWLDEGLHSLIYLDGIVTIVDGCYGYEYIVNEGVVKEGHGQSQRGMNEATRQIALADRVLINKVDLVNEAEIQKLETVIKRINAVAPIAKTIRSK